MVLYLYDERGAAESTWSLPREATGYRANIAAVHLTELLGPYSPKARLFCERLDCMKGFFDRR